MPTGEFLVHGSTEELVGLEKYELHFKVMYRNVSRYSRGIDVYGATRRCKGITWEVVMKERQGGVD